MNMFPYEYPLKQRMPSICVPTGHHPVLHKPAQGEVGDVPCVCLIHHQHTTKHRILWPLTICSKACYYPCYEVLVVTICRAGFFLGKVSCCAGYVQLRRICKRSHPPLLSVLLVFVICVLSCVLWSWYFSLPYFWDIMWMTWDIMWMTCLGRWVM